MGIRLVVAIAIFVGLCTSASADPSVSYIPNVEIQLTPKSDPAQIEIYQQGEKPARPGATLGAFIADSDGSQNEEVLFQMARKKAAELGGDLIIVTRATNRTRISKDPSLAFAIPFLRIPMIAGVSHSGDVQYKDVPKIVFAIGAYSRSSFGVIWEPAATAGKEKIVKDFRSYSAAPKAGLRVRDTILEMNGMLPDDKRLIKFFLEAAPGTQVALFVKRGDERLTINIETVEAR